MKCKCGSEMRWAAGGIRNGKPKCQWVCPSCERLRQERYRKKNGSKSKLAWYRSDRSRRKAHKAVELAILRGEIVRQPCGRCGDKNSHAHHDDHNRPLDVMWLCPIHHGERHRELRHTAQ